MIEISAAVFFAISALLEQALIISGQHFSANKPITDNDRRIASDTLGHISFLCSEAELPLSAMYIERMLTQTSKPDFTFKRYNHELDILKERLKDELVSIRF